jgi:hemoglobin
MKDIETRRDLERLMAAFYEKLLADPEIAFVFTDVAQMDLQAHLPHIVDFWDANLLQGTGYAKNVMKIHLDLNDKIHLEKRYFDIWLGHLFATIDAHFTGERAETMKTRALSVATVMQIKMGNR